jgi:DNA-directed RNA polymerase subunit omega
MARLTVEDCLENVDNRYDLVMIASKRARQIAMGAEPLVPGNQDKPTVIALREIAENLVNPDNIDKINQFDTEDEFTEADFAIPTPAAPAE